MKPIRPEQEIERLRAFRVRPERDLTLARELDRERRELVKQHKAVGGLGSSWEELVPPRLARIAHPEKLTPGGLLTIRASDAAAAFEVDVWLRSGGEAALRARCSRALKRIRVVHAS